MAEPNLELLQAMVQRVLDGQARHDGEFREVKHRLTTLELSVAGVRRDFALMSEQQAMSSLRTDTLEDRIGSVKNLGQPACPFRTDRPG